LRFSEADRIATTIDIVDRGLLQNAGIRSTTLAKSHSPLVPNLSVRVVAPNLDLNDLALANNQRNTDWEVEREPRLHGWRMLFRLDAVENVLIELCSKVTSEAMQLRLSLLDSEGHAAILAQRLSFTLRHAAKRLIIRVGQMPEGEDIRGVRAARVRC